MEVRDLKIISYNMKNYKSIGKTKNTLLLDQNITALIGKNESGKTNVLEAIGETSFLSPLNATYLTNQNRITNEKIDLKVELEFYKNELEIYDIEQSITRIEYQDAEKVTISGGLSNLIKNDQTFQEAINAIVETKNQKEIWGTDRTRVKRINNIIDALLVLSEEISTNFENELRTLSLYIVKDFKDREALLEKIEIIKKKNIEYYELLPRIYYRDTNRELKTSYKLNDIKEHIKNESHIFTSFLEAAKIKKDELINAFENPVDANRKTAINKLENKIKINIEEKFNEFYHQEKIELQIDIEMKTFKLYVLTGDSAMNFSERSNGLRWYFSLFIDIISQNLEDKSTLFLFDEPGVFLHVNAQKELLRLFEDLTNNNNQIIYTTHSPYMINNKDILNIRVIEKTKNGITRIFKNAYNQDISEESKLETLSPLVEALGADLKYNIGPSSSSNIITEGITDYIYLKAMMKHLKLSNPPNIIPSTGASNVNRLVSILIGWGINFKVLLDYDSAGLKEYEVLTNKLDISLKEKVFFVNAESNIDEDEVRNNPMTIESLISQRDFDKLSNKVGKEKSKILVAKEFHDKVSEGKIQLEEKTIANFNKLLSSII